MEEKSINAQILELHKEGKTVSEIAKAVSHSYQRVYNALVVKGETPKLSGRKTGEKKQKIIECLERGLSIMKTCKEVNTYPPYVLKVKKEWKASKETPVAKEEEEEVPAEVVTPNTIE